MVEITKNKLIEGRPLFRSSNAKAKQKKGSFLKRNALFKVLDPSNCPRKIQVAFLKFKESIKPYFSVQQPDPIQANIVEVVRPKNEGVLTLGNLWNYHKKFLDNDKECPKNVKAAFEVLKRDEKKFKEIRKDDKKIQIFTSKTEQEVLNLPIGKTRLFLFQRKESLDQSINGGQVCSITKTPDGYTIQLIGHDLDAKNIPLAG